MIPSGVEIVYKPLDEMLACAGEANVIFTSTASETPLFLKEHVESLPLPGSCCCQQRRHGEEGNGSSGYNNRGN
ncbi:unnamed protein product [Brassica oleracea]|uniref:(rape) hypothetical protein n=1 Tax=Brassica napus TaxID=3708 RepID=A0A816RPE7_BRANA|nr:unnamed protein product [Brassica napus]